MKNFYKSARKELTEMAAPKMPEGTKRKRSATYAHVHDIHIGGEHVATIGGHRANRRADGRGLPAHAKIYQVHNNEEGMLKGEHHKDHSFEKMESYPTAKPGGGWDYEKAHMKTVRRPVEYHSMEDAVHSVIHTHNNNKEFGKNHDPRVRWAKALDSVTSVVHHNEKTAKYHHAVDLAQRLGHPDVVSALESHRDAHIAAGAGNGVSSHKIAQWTHDAHRYSGTTYDSSKPYGERDHPTHPEHHGLAQRAHSLHNSHHRY
jgi:hypothetical protein